MSFNNSSEQENYGARHSDSVNKKTSERHSSSFGCFGCFVVVLSLGFLAAFAAPFIFSSTGPHAEFRNINEVLQMNAAVERFEIKYGFYPPTIGQGLEVESAEDFLEYLDQIAPNHAEGTGVDGGGLQRWWTNVGRHLDARSSLVFWLSGLCSSKKYPLSGKATLRAPLAPYHANRFFDDSEFTDDTGILVDLTIDRDVFFEFRLDQLISCQNGVPLGIKGCNQQSGRGEFMMHEYRDFRSYAGSTPGSVLEKAYHRGVDDNGNPKFFNPSSFQIVGPGMDGKMSDQPVANTNLAVPAGVDPAQDDNITNFSSGRLDRLFE